MKKLFTMIVVCAATFACYTASADAPHAVKGAKMQTISQNLSYTSSNLRAVSCDTLLNEGPLDTPNIYLSGSPNVGYFTGSGALNAGGTTFYPIVGIGEEYTTNVTTPHVTAAFVLFGLAEINPASADSAIKVTCYVYDTSGTSLIFNQIAPGNALDSASVTLGSIANDVTNQNLTVFNFTHQPQLPGTGFFVTVSIPQTTGDSIAVASNQGTTGNGNGWIELSAQGQAAWGSLDSLTGGDPIGTYILASVCSSASVSCPTITVTATQQGHSEIASATGGIAPYTYHFSSGTTTADSVSNLATGTYSVTATDANGCTGAISFSFTAATCPTITVTATEFAHETAASATAAGGTAPYTYAWSGGSASATTDTVTGLVNGSTYTVTATDHNGCTGTATVSISTGIEAMAAGVTSFSIFPNPSNGVFTANVSLVAASDVTITVTDMTGSKIFESTDKAVKDLNKQINLSTIATGIYFVSVKTAQGTANQRIVIK